MNSTGGDDERRRALSRRELLAAGVGGAAASGILGPFAGSAGAAQSAVGGPSVNGTLKRVDGDAIVLEDCHTSLDWSSSGLPAVGGGETAVRVDRDTSLYRDGVVALDAFEPGDKLIAQVRRGASELTAAAVEPIYVGVDEDVLSRSGGRLATRDGTVVVTDRTQLSSGDRLTAFRELSSGTRAATLQRLDRVRAMCRLDPSSGDYVAAIVVDPATP